MTKFRNLGIFLMVFALISVTSCSEDDDATLSTADFDPATVDDIVNFYGTLNSLNSALDVASGDLSASLNGSESVTLFAPTNDAFSSLAASAGFESSAELLANIDPNLLATILTYHVVAGESDAGSISSGAPLPTLQGGEIGVTAFEDGSFQLEDATNVPQTNTSASVTDTDARAGNGIVHYINKVLLPQEAIDALNLDIRPSIVQFATTTEDLSTLVTALESAMLTETIVGLDTATVLAPSNQAFENLYEFLGDDYDSIVDFDNDVELSLLADILSYHVLTARVSSSDLAAGQAETALEGATVEVVAENGGFTFGDVTDENAGIVQADIEANNGVIHVIDKVLLPEAVNEFFDLLETPDLATTVTTTDTLSVLTEALVATGLADAFVDATNTTLDPEATNFTYFRTATVFAPTNAAFADLLDLLGDDYTGIDSFDTEEELELLETILLYHVLPGSTLSGALAPGNLTTAAGSDIEIIAEVGSDSFVIGDATNNINANIGPADITARNGVAHVIDKVLLPASAIAFIDSLNEDEMEEEEEETEEETN